MQMNTESYLLIFYVNIYQIYINLYKMHNISKKYQAASGPAQAKGRAPALRMSRIYLDIFWYVFGNFSSNNQRYRESDQAHMAKHQRQDLYVRKV